MFDLPSQHRQRQHCSVYIFPFVGYHLINHKIFSFPYLIVEVHGITNIILSSFCQEKTRFVCMPQCHCRWVIASLRAVSPWSQQPYPRGDYLHLQDSPPWEDMQLNQISNWTNMRVISPTAIVRQYLSTQRLLQRPPQEHPAWENTCTTKSIKWWLTFTTQT